MKKVILFIVIILTITLSGCEEVERVIELDEIYVYGNNVELIFRKESELRDIDIKFEFRNVTPGSEGMDHVFADNLGNSGFAAFAEFELEYNQDYELIITSDNTEIITNHEIILIRTFTPHVNVSDSIYAEFQEDVINYLSSIDDYTAIMETDINWDTNDFKYTETIIMKSKNLKTHRWVVRNPNKQEVYEINIYQDNLNNFNNQYTEDRHGLWSTIVNPNGFIDSAHTFMGINYNDQYIFNIEKTKDTMQETKYVLTLSEGGYASLLYKILSEMYVNYFDLSGYETIEIEYTLTYGKLSNIEIDFSRLVSVAMDEKVHSRNYAEINFILKDVLETEEIVIPEEAYSN